jgi:alkylation response protein AidB-like acyl-CoA dehydrogenase
MSTMELGLSSDQELLRETAARFIDTACPLSAVRRLIGSESGLPSGYIRGAGELGWFAPLVPEELGGGSVSGEGLRDLAIIAEERGRALQPGPFIGMNVAAAALAAAGTPEQQARMLPSICAGEVTAAWVFGDAVAGPAPGAPVTATPHGGGFTISGRATPVPAAPGADWLLVSTDGKHGVSQFLVEATSPGITVTALEALDVTQRYGVVSFDEAVVPAASAIGHPGGSERDVEVQLQLACVLSTAETVGAMAALFELTRRYAIDRTAFGRPIGSFQAVKHQLADLSLALETSKAVTAAAVRAVQDDRKEAGEIVSMAKSWVADAGIDLAQGCAQVFAGIGFTWEHDLHLFLRRITMNGVLFGQPDWHRERICQAHGLSQ